MSHKRYKDQIILNILQVCAGGQPKRKLSINPASNFHTIILDLLTHSGLVVRTEGTIRDDRQGRSSARAQCREREEEDDMRREHRMGL